MHSFILIFNLSNKYEFCKNILKDEFKTTKIVPQ